MKRFWLAVAAATIVAACSGGNPWLEDGTGTGPEDGTGPEIPAALLGDLDSITYDPVAQTLTVRGIAFDNAAFEAVYSRKYALDMPGGYAAYTSQNTALERHSTAFVKEMDGTRAAIVVTGGQFENFFGGSYYSRAGAFTTPGGQVTYAGRYVGLLNIAGDGGDLLPIIPGTPHDVRPVQAAEVTGRVLINADFSDNRVEGIVYDRVIVDHPGYDLSNQDIALMAADILADGSFAGEAQQELIGVGTFGGIFGGTDASVVAGTLFAEGHISQINDVQEFGLFVLGQCGTANADPICNQPSP